MNSIGIDGGDLRYSLSGQKSPSERGERQKTGLSCGPGCMREVSLDEPVFEGEVEPGVGRGGHIDPMRVLDKDTGESARRISAHNGHDVGCGPWVRDVRLTLSG